MRCMADTRLLDTWERALKIKKLRNDATEAALDEGELKMFGDKVEKLIDQRVKERVAQMTLEARSQNLRRQAMETGLTWVHRALLARIERGVTIEARALPPLLAKGEDAEDADDGTGAAVFATLNELAPRREIPAPNSQPILRLPAAESPKSPKAGAAAG